MGSLNELNLKDILSLTNFFTKSDQVDEELLLCLKAGEASSRLTWKKDLFRKNRTANLVFLHRKLKFRQTKILVDNYSLKGQARFDVISTLDDSSFTFCNRFFPPELYMIY